MQYRIKEVKPNIFAVLVKDKYDRAMLFCRFQEYYESPNPKFRGKNFSIWDYMKWYNTKYKRGFSYGTDWSGFNIPWRVINECICKLNKFETPYDIIMNEISYEIGKRSSNGYLIACKDTKGETFKHEVCHGLYYTDENYRKKVDEVTKQLPKKHYNIFKKNLIEMGYTTKVINDEIQAYLQYGFENSSFSKGVPLKQASIYNKLYTIQS